MQEVWRSVVALLAYPHVWPRKAAGRLLGLLLANNKLGMTAYCLYLPIKQHGQAACCLIHTSTIEDSKVNNRHTQVMQGVCLKCQE